MKKIVLGLVLIVPLILFVRGCKRNPPSASKNGAAKTSTPQRDLLKPALDLFSAASEANQFRDALHHLNAYLSKDPDKQVTPLTSDEKENLRKLYQLDKEEMAEVEASLFRPRDAYHLQSCFLFRDISRLVEIPNLPAHEQARLCFELVMRRLVLHEQADEGLPPAVVLQRGFGSGLDRALVFLSLLRQFQIEGCLIRPPGDASTLIWAGVLVLDDQNKEQKPTLLLFDPVLGRPVLGPEGKSIATLDDVRAHPGLLKMPALSDDTAAKLRIYHAGPVEALSARMRYLQDLLAFQDKVVLFQDATVAHRDLTKAAGKEVPVWNAASQPRRPAVTDALRQFLTPEEGGIDKKNRQQRFLSQQYPDAIIDLQFQEMRLFLPNDMPELGLLSLKSYARELFSTFVLPAKEFMLRGQFDAALKRLDRVRNVLETEEAAKPVADDVFKSQLKAWRKRVFDAYFALQVRKDPAGLGKVNTLWNEDRYLQNVLQADSDIPLETFEKKLLTLILLNACREPLGQQVNYLAASCTHEKAAQLQANYDALVAAGKDVSNIEKDANIAWRNARTGWNRYLDRYSMTVQSLPKRLGEISQRWQRGDIDPIKLWEQLHQDMHATYQARLFLADVQGQLRASPTALKELLADLEAFQKSDLPKSLARDLERVQGSPVPANRLKLLWRDWEPQGNIFWLQETARGLSEKGQ